MAKIKKTIKKASKSKNSKKQSVKKSKKAPQSKYQKNKKIKKQRQSELTDIRKKQIKRYIQLVNLIKSSKNGQNQHFQQMVNMMKSKIMNSIKNVRIPGLTPNDVYQQALYALRYKAIPDYDASRSQFNIVSSYDSFALLCIKRHLSTKRKTAWQGKQAVLNGALSIDQDRSKNSNQNEQSTGLISLLQTKNGCIMTDLQKSTDFAIMQKRLLQQMSSFQIQVYLLYKRDLSYQEMAQVIYNKKVGKTTQKQLKSIDNTLARTRIKAKQIYIKYNKQQQ